MEGSGTPRHRNVGGEKLRKGDVLSNLTTMSLPDVHHIGMVVADRDATIARYRNELGLGPFQTFPGQLQVNVRGADTRFGLGIGFVWLGNIMLELLEPLDDRSPHAEWLAEHGEGVHHFGYFVESIAEQLGPVKEGKLTWLLDDATGPENVPAWGYLEGAAGGMVIELIPRNPENERFFEELWRNVGADSRPRARRS